MINSNPQTFTRRFFEQSAHTYKRNATQRNATQRNANLIFLTDWYHIRQSLF
jgi:hypothetical protein